MDPLLTPGPSREEAPDSVLLPLDARYITGGISPGVAAVEFARLRGLWRAAQDIGAAVLHQAALFIFPSLLGEAKHLMPGSPAALLATYNERLQHETAYARVLVLSNDRTPRRTASPPGTIPRSGTARSRKSTRR